MRTAAMILIFYLALRAGGQTNSQAVSLRERATVVAATIQASDLLPANVAPEIRRIASCISLGRAPEPGSLRVFSSQALEKALAGKIAAAIPPQIIVSRSGSPIAAAQVQSALESFRGASADWRGAQVFLPPGLSSRDPDAALEALDLSPSADPHVLRARLRCRLRRQCAPFWAEVRTTHPASIFRKKTAAASAKPAALVRPGKPAFLVLEQSGMRIRLLVIPLKRAAMGENVRVLDPATRRAFSARVQGENLVSSNLGEAR